MNGLFLRRLLTLLALLKLILLLVLDVGNGEHQADATDRAVNYGQGITYGRLTHFSLPNFRLSAISSFPTVS